MTTCYTFLAPRYLYQRFTHASLSPVVPQTFIYVAPSIWCHTVLPCHFISDIISSALLLLKGGEVLLCQQRVLGDLLVLGAGLWCCLSSQTCCMNNGSDNGPVTLWSSGTLYIQMYRKLPAKHAVELMHQQITNTHTHARYNMFNEKCASEKL